MRNLQAVIRKTTPVANGFLKVNRYEIEADKHEGGTHLISWEVMESGNAEHDARGRDGGRRRRGGKHRAR